MGKHKEKNVHPLKAAAMAFSDEPIASAKSSKTNKKKKKKGKTGAVTVSTPPQEEESLVHDGAEEETAEFTEETAEFTEETDLMTDDFTEDQDGAHVNKRRTKKKRKRRSRSAVTLAALVDELEQAMQVVSKLPEGFTLCYGALEKSGLRFIEKNRKVFRTTNSLVSLPGVKSGLTFIPQLGYTLYYLADIQDLALLLRSYRSSSSVTFSPLEERVAHFLTLTRKLLNASDSAPSAIDIDKFLDVRNRTICDLTEASALLDFFCAKARILSSIFEVVDKVISRSKSLLAGRTIVQKLLKYASRLAPLLGALLFVSLCSLFLALSQTTYVYALLISALAIWSFQWFFFYDAASTSVTGSEAAAGDEEELLSAEIEYEIDHAEGDKIPPTDSSSPASSVRRRSSALMKRRVSETFHTLKSAQQRIRRAARAKMANAGRVFLEHGQKLSEAIAFLEQQALLLKLLVMRIDEMVGALKLHLFATARISGDFKWTEIDQEKLSKAMIHQPKTGKV